MAFAFGVLAGDLFLGLGESLFIYAGSAQFLSLRLLESGAPLLEVALSCFALNLRHIFYSLQFASKYNGLGPIRKWYSVFALTDETYAVLAGPLHKDLAANTSLIFPVSFLNQMTWVFGTLVGLLAKQGLSLNIKGLDFFLVALFIVLLVEQLKKNRHWFDFGIAVMIGLVLLNLQIPGWLFIAMGAVLAYSFVSTKEAHSGN